MSGGYRVGGLGVSVCVCVGGAGGTIDRHCRAGIHTDTYSEITGSKISQVGGILAG